jgi:hypothetical protein
MHWEVLQLQLALGSSSSSTAAMAGGARLVEEDAAALGCMMMGGTGFQPGGADIYEF